MNKNEKKKREVALGLIHRCYPHCLQSLDLTN